MSQEDSSPDSYFAWSMILALILMLGMLAVTWPQIAQETGDNLAAVAVLQEWSRKSKDLSQIVCEKSEQAPVPAAEDGRVAVVNAARRAYFAGDCERALAYWTLALEEDPQNETAALMRFLSSGLDKEMFPAQISTGDVAMFLRGLGFSAEQNQIEDQAVHWFTNAFEIEPSSTVADRLVDLAGNPDEQVQTWQHLAGSLPDDDPDYWWAVGQDAELSQDWDRAAEAYAAGSEISSEPYDFLLRQGKVLMKLAVWEDALSSFQQASEVKPGRIEPYLEIGQIHRQQRNFDDALVAYEQVLAQSPDNFPANYFLGLTYYRLEDDQQAQLFLQRALELRPNHAESAYTLAQSLNRAGDTQSARDFLELALSLQKDKSWNWLMTLGDWRYTDGDTKGALDAYQEALVIQPSSEKLRNRIIEIEGTGQQ